MSNNATQELYIIDENKDVYSITKGKYIFVTENYQPEQPKTSKSQWYHGTLNREEAVKILQEYCKTHNLEGKMCDGLYLVRYSDRHNSAYVLTMLSENTPYNFIIRQEVIICFDSILLKYNRVLITL